MTRDVQRGAADATVPSEAVAVVMALTAEVRAALQRSAVTAVAVARADKSAFPAEDVDPPADAVLDEDGFDRGGDGDFVDDTPPALPVTEAPAATTPVTTVAAVTAPEKPHRKHNAKAPKKAAVSPPADPDDVPQPARAAKKDKPRKHRAEPAEAP